MNPCNCWRQRLENADRFIAASMKRGMATGCIYALAALGFTLLWQASGTINFAQGEFVMLPAFVMVIMLHQGLPLTLAFLLACGQRVRFAAWIGGMCIWRWRRSRTQREIRRSRMVTLM